MEQIYGLKWVLIEEQWLRVCKHCKEQAGILELYRLYDNGHIRHICRCKGCGHYISITREVADNKSGETEVLD